MKPKTSLVVLTMICLVAGLFTSSICTAAEREDDETPWWEREKIRFFWGQWAARFREGTAPLSWDEIMGNIRAVGANVFVAQAANPLAEDLAVAKIAQKHGLKYLATKYTSDYRDIAKALGSRLAVNRDGFTSQEEAARGMAIRVPFVPCPLDEDLVNEWLLKPALRIVESGVIDGWHIDMESYGATSFDRRDSYLCYCDDCFANYAAKKKLTATRARSERYTWLQEQGLLRDYLGHQRDRLADLYRRVAQRIRKVKPDFIFSVYEYFAPDDLEDFWRMEGVLMGLHSPSAPVFFCDPTHYNVNRTVPWWESSYARIRKLGVKHIPGSYTATVYGNYPARAISAEQWMYEAAMSYDGYWLWFEHRFGPTDYAVFRAAEHRIAEIENRVGDLLIQGRQDNTFVCLVEQSGNPNRSEFVWQRSYHLDERHLVWVFNGNDDHRVEVLVRIPRLPKPLRWTVTAARSSLRYTHTGSSVWTSEDLARGVPVVIEKRSDVWLVLAPDDGQGAGRSLSADVIRAHPNRPDTGQNQPEGSAPAGASALLYVKQEPLTIYRGVSMGDPNPVVGTSVHTIDVSGAGGQDRRLFPVRSKPYEPLGSNDVAGYCWHPVFSPDRTRVAFACWVNGKGQIYVMNADGSSPRNISGNDSCDTWPVWSPDGKRIAFASDRHGDWDLYVMDPDGRGSLRLTQSPGVDKHPSWSPDGKSIAFVSDRNGDFDLYIVGADGQGQRQLLSRPGNEYDPRWSPDGTRLACTAGMHGGGWRDIVVLDPRTGDMEHPKGLAYAAKNSLWQYDNVHSIRWSPDGKQIAGVFEVRWRSGIFVIDLDPLDLREPLAAEPLKPKPGGSLPYYKLVGGWYSDGNSSRRWLTREFGSIEWLPDGRRIAFRSDMDSSGYDFLWTVGEDGTDVVRIDESFSPAGPNDKLPARANDKLGLLYEMPGAAMHGRTLLSLPQQWLFRTDPQDIGEKQRWFDPSADLGSFKPLSTHTNWEAQWVGAYDGAGWYVTDVTIPQAEGKRVWLLFGAVDETWKVWLDGKYIGASHGDPGVIWDKPAALEITGKYPPGKKVRLVVRVHDIGFAGGIWKPVRITASD